MKVVPTQKNYFSRNSFRINLNRTQKIFSVLCKSSTPMNMADKMGLMLTLTIFAAILTPIAFSDNDPYHLKNAIGELQSILNLEEILGNSGKDDPRVIVYLKISPEYHLESIERVIQGKIKPYSF